MPFLRDIKESVCVCLFIHFLLGMKDDPQTILE